MKYWAFLSYSHTDKKWGDWLHKALETYRVPRRLVGKESRDGKIPERLFPIFRDREELPVSADLGANINEALRESRYLIVICSPRSAQSRWVGEEIKTFKKLGREDRILALIVDGEPNASDGKPGFKIEDECFHEAMRYRMVDGEVSEIRSEPIAADAREGKDGKTNAKLKLLAGLLGVNYDDLKRREQERRLKRARMIAAASVALIAIFAALSVAFFFNARAARRARDEARATLSRSDFLQALRSIDEGKDFDALAQLARSLRFNPNNQAARCRLATLLIYRNYPTSVLVLKHDAVVQSAQFSPDGKKIMAVALDNAVRVWDAETGALVGNPMRHNVYVRSAQFSPDTTKVATVSEDKTVWIWDAQNGSLVTSIKHDQRVWSVQFSPDGKLLLTASPNRAGLEKVQLWDADSGMAVGKPLSAGCAQFSPDGKRIATGSEDGTAQIWDVKTGEALTGPMKHDGSIHSVEFSPNGKRILTVWVAEGGNGWAARAWDAGTGRPVGEVMKHPDDVIVSAHFSPNSKRVVTAIACLRLNSAGMVGR
ncbi:MAG: hypothetical protein DMF26_21465 [Verrucomicrobia bacterium]|nr:MAG: hypothetical protein DMF26_21465 [Verrucomicrobiota bacterium]